MKALVPDTNVLIRLFEGDEEVAKTLSTCERMVLSPVVLGEFRAGLDPETKLGRATEDGLRTLLSANTTEVLSLDETTSGVYARIRRFLKKIGKPIPTNDIWIAAQALQHALPVYTFDGHFANVPMLDVIHTKLCSTTIP